MAAVTSHVPCMQKEARSIGLISIFLLLKIDTPPPIVEERT